MARSGGGGGTTRNGQTAAGNNPYMTNLVTSGPKKGKGHVHGGPIPMGTYAVGVPFKHPRLGLAARLIPAHKSTLMDRGNDFFIHGRGPHGSDGCIVPLSNFEDLMVALKAAQGGTLIVEETTGGERFA
jgi:hypothetical protein